MKPDRRFLNLHKSFWANVRAISETTGYTERGKGVVRVPTLEEMTRAMATRNLSADHLTTDGRRPTELGRNLQSYFKFRARILNDYVKPRLMDTCRAKREFKRLHAELKPGDDCPLPMNKQKGSKRAEAYLTCMVNMIIEANCAGLNCDFDPRVLTTITANKSPLRTLARRVDGAFPSTVNPIAIWEIKEYYHTTTFGSRVADAVYETLLDGMELSELKEHEGVHVLHYLIVDARYTWWDCGRSYLCRILDAMHMGYIDEAIFGYEVIERLPGIVRSWCKIVRKRRAGTHA